MNCPSCGDSEYYSGFMGHNCPNPSCELEGNKRQTKPIKSSITNIKFLVDSDKYLGFQIWTNPTEPIRSYHQYGDVLYKDEVVLIQGEDDAWYSYVEIDGEWRIVSRISGLCCLCCVSDMDHAWKEAVIWKKKLNSTP